MALLAFSLAGAPALPAQLQRTRSDLDSVQTALRDRLVALRDTIRPVSAELVAFRRDIASAGPETVVHKARRLNGACTVARAALVNAVPWFARSDVPRPAGAAADSLQAALRALVAALDEHCLTGLAASSADGQADSLRAWGPYRTGQLRLAIDRLHGSMSRFADASRFRLPPPSPR
jgi:hypothetical protein